MSKSCRMCGEILSHATCPHCGSQYSICDGCDHTEPGRRLPEPVREALAAVSHAIWAHWMRYLFSVSVKCKDGSFVIIPDYASRWQRQMDTAYSDLSEREKESDRHQADKILAVLPTPVAAPEPVVTPDLLVTLEGALYGDEACIDMAFEWIDAQRDGVSGE